jgi:hypothetical protein
MLILLCFFFRTRSQNASGQGAANQASKLNARAQKVFDFWTQERIAQVKPRDMVVNGPYSDRQLRAQKGVDLPYDASLTPQVGRILFQMGNSYYVCSGTTVADPEKNGRSIIMTAAHCVYDDQVKAFATNVMFIPQQDDGGTDKSDSNCSNDPYGCWAPDFGVVDFRWTANTWPNNIQWDYAYYVVSDTGAHTGGTLGTLPNDSLQEAVGALAIDFTDYTSLSNPCPDGPGTLMGYSYNQDPDFRYCPVSLVRGSQGWEFPNCGLSGGSSGGPGMFGCNTGEGPLISVVSWGYQNRPYMGGPYLFGQGNLAQCMFHEAMSQSLAGIGIIVSSTCTISSTTTQSPPTTTSTTQASKITTTTTTSSGATCSPYKGAACTEAGCCWSKGSCSVCP